MILFNKVNESMPLLMVIDKLSLSRGKIKTI
jgi:hypothetical protein